MASPSAQPVFPEGIRVLIVDHHASSSTSLENMLKKYNYEVCKAKLATEALDLLGGKNEKYNFDIVIMDLNMGDMDAFQFIQHVAGKLDVLVIMICKNGETNSLMRGFQSGACHYLWKPVLEREARFIWQHVYRKRMSKQPQIVGGEGNPNAGEVILNEGTNGGELGEVGGHLTVKKTRAAWGRDHHDKFLKALAQIESANEKVGPKKILELMSDTNYTREQIASHLQKYRNKSGVVAAAQAPDAKIQPQQLPPLVQQPNVMVGENSGQQRRMQPGIVPDENYGYSMNSFGQYTIAYHHDPQNEVRRAHFMGSISRDAPHNQIQNPLNLQGAYGNNGPNTQQIQISHNVGVYGNNGPNTQQIQIQIPHNVGPYGNSGPNVQQIQNPHNVGAYGDNGQQIQNPHNVGAYGDNGQQIQNPHNVGAYGDNGQQIQNPHNVGAYGNNGPNTQQIDQNPLNVGTYGNNGLPDYHLATFDEEFPK